MTRIGRRTWITALAVALAVHAGAAILLALQPAPSGAQSPGRVGVSVGLSSAGAPPGASAAAGNPSKAVEAAPAAAKDAAAEAVERVTAETVPTVAAEPTVTEAAPVRPELQQPSDPASATAPKPAPPVVAEAARPVDDLPSLDAVDASEATVPDKVTPPPPPPETVPQAAEIAEAAPVEREIQAVEPTPPPAEKQVAKTESAPVPPPPARPERPVQRRKTAPLETAERQPAETEAAQPEAPAAEPAADPVREPVADGETDLAMAPAASRSGGAGENGQADSVPGAGGRAGSKAAPDVGSGDGQAGGGAPGAKADYLAMLQAWLERHKEYPRRAQRRRQEGTATLFFVMSRDGEVLDYRIEESSGHAALDREVEEMIRRAQPLPAMPADMRQARLEIRIPVRFHLR